MSSSSESYFSSQTSRAWHDLFALLNQDDPNRVNSWVAHHPDETKQMISGVLAQHALSEPLRTFWRGLLDRGWLVPAQNLFNAVNGQVGAELLVEILDRHADPAFRKLGQALTRKVKTADVMEAACGLGNTGVVERLLARGPQPTGLARGFALTLRTQNEAMSEWLWPHIQQYHLLGQSHVETVVLQGRLDWLDRFRPHMTRALWAPLLFELLKTVPIERHQHEALMQEGIRWFTPANDKPNDRANANHLAWLDQWLSQAVKLESPWLPVAVAHFPSTSPTTASFIQAARTGMVEPLAPLAGQADWAAVKKALAPRRLPRLDQLDRLAPCVPKATLEAWVKEHPQELPQSTALLRSCLANDQAPPPPPRTRVRSRS